MLRSLTCIFCLSILYAICGYKVHAQVPVTDSTGVSDDILENAVENDASLESGIESYQENIESLAKHPVNINTASYYELINTGLFTDVQCRNLLQHIRSYGALLNLYELQTIPGFETEDIKKMLPFITTGNINANNNAFIKQLYQGRYQYFVRLSKVLEEQSGFNGDTSVTSPYLGNNLRVYTRIKYNYNNQLMYGITAEKDPGEELFGGSQPNGFDYYSFHFFKKSDGFVRSLALGDYEVNIGQGLMLWSGFGFGKSTFPVAVKRSAKVLDSYSSVDENRFMRGAAATLGKKDLLITPFISYKKIDANISVYDSVDAEVAEISSLQTSGLHRNENELADKHAIQQTIGGIDISYYKEQFSAGVSAVYYHFSSELNRDPDPYQYYDFEGDQLLNAGLHYNFLLRNILFFGETAVSGNKRPGTLNGFIIPIDRVVDIAVVHRYYDRAYQSIYSNAFGDASTPSNENGTYIGTEIKPARGWKISGYIDVYKHPWLEFAAEAPSYGTDVLGEINFKPNKQFETYLRIKNEIQDDNAGTAYTEDLVHDVITERTKQNVRWHLSYKLNTAVTLQSRIEYALYEEAISEIPEKGYLLYQDVKYKPLSAPFSIAGRFAFFNTDSYNTRIYTFETDVLYAYSIVALYGRGTRGYLTLEYSPAGWIDIWLRYARTWYTDEEITANADITGAAKSDGRVQVRLKW